MEIRKTADRNIILSVMFFDIDPLSFLEAEIDGGKTLITVVEIEVLIVFELDNRPKLIGDAVVNSRPILLRASFS